MHCTLCYLLICFPFVTVRSISNSLSTGAFKYVTSPNVTALSVGTGWSSRTLSACAAACLQQNPSCLAFAYNATTKSCIEVTLAKSCANSTAGKIYMRSDVDNQIPPCVLPVGFQMYSNGNITVNAKLVSTKVKSYNESAMQCTLEGARLITVTSMEKLQVVATIANSLHVWVGCDDFDGDHHFKWNFDGSPVPDKLMDTLAWIERNYSYPSGNCCKLHPVAPLYLHISPCIEVNFYVCEM